MKNFTFAFVFCLLLSAFSLSYANQSQGNDDLSLADLPEMEELNDMFSDIEEDEKIISEAVDEEENTEESLSSQDSKTEKADEISNEPDEEKQSESIMHQAASTEKTPLEVDFSVVNISQNNTNAVMTGVNAGDLLRYNVLLKGRGNVSDYEPKIIAKTNIDYTEMIEMGQGEIADDQSIVFPQFSIASNPPSWSKVYTFTLRVRKNIPANESLVLQFEDQELAVKFINSEASKQQKNLSATGPMGIFVAILILFIIGKFVLFAKKT